jgi:hypothetical protein
MVRDFSSDPELADSDEPCATRAELLIETLGTASMCLRRAADDLHADVANSKRWLALGARWLRVLDRIEDHPCR